jgi:hypothetical protein
LLEYFILKCQCQQLSSLNKIKNLGIKKWQLELLNIEGIQAFSTQITLDLRSYFIPCFFLEEEQLIHAHNNKIHTIYKQTRVFVFIFSML